MDKVALGLANWLVSSKFGVMIVQIVQGDVVKRAFSPRDLAKAIGVSESSLKRWVDDGLIHASRTAGGHRRITLTEAVRFVRASSTPLAHPEILGLPDLDALDEPLPAREEQADRMFELLRDGQAEQARSLAMLMYLDGQSIAEICDGPISSSMHELGKLWLKSDSGIHIEHRAMDLCAGVMNQLRILIDVDTNAPIAIGGAPTGDPYLLPSLMAAATLEDIGFRAINLGPESPAVALLRAAVDWGASLVWLSISVAQDRKSIGESIATLIESLDRAGISLIIGGRARTVLTLPNVSHLHIGNSMAELSAFARGLQIAAGPTTSQQQQSPTMN